MKKNLFIVLAVLLLSCLFVSCSSSPKEKIDSVVFVSDETGGLASKYQFNRDNTGKIMTFWLGEYYPDQDLDITVQYENTMSVSISESILSELYAYPSNDPILNFDELLACDYILIGEGQDQQVLSKEN